MSKANLHHASILVVEDDQALNDAYTMILQKAGHAVSRAFNGKEALEVFAALAEKPDIILLDLRMPVMGGVDFLREFQPKTHPDTTVVVFSNYDAHSDIDTAYSLGVERYVLKARCAPNDLLHLVDGILADRYEN
ncbi:response regulator [Candidatus Saccharibacteria bacterium]|nr:MAG: response regulator [Candidatus Saccharibacteria bacterium]